MLAYHIVKDVEEKRDYNKCKFIYNKSNNWESLHKEDKTGGKLLLVNSLRGTYFILSGKLNVKLKLKPQWPILSLPLPILLILVMVHLQNFLDFWANSNKWTSLYSPWKPTVFMFSHIAHPHPTPIPFW